MVIACKKNIAITDQFRLLVLDSWVHEEPAKQVVQIDQIFTQYAHLPNKFVVYHTSVYPSKPQEVPDITAQLQQHWAPLFDKHGVAIALENHFHLLKISQPINNHTIVPLGKGTMYLGDGAMGVPPSSFGSVPSMIKRQESTCHIYVLESSTKEIDVKVLAYGKGNNTVTARARMATGENDASHVLYHFKGK